MYPTLQPYFIKKNPSHFFIFEESFRDLKQPWPQRQAKCIQNLEVCLLNKPAIHQCSTVTGRELYIMHPILFVQNRSLYTFQPTLSKVQTLAGPFTSWAKMRHAWSMQKHILRLIITLMVTKAMLLKCRVVLRSSLKNRKAASPARYQPVNDCSKIFGWTCLNLTLVFIMKILQYCILHSL